LVRGDRARYLISDIGIEASLQISSGCKLYLFMQVSWQHSFVVRYHSGTAPFFQNGHTSKWHVWQYVNDTAKVKNSVCLTTKREKEHAHSGR
jgi:hypothetical protein